MPGSRARAVPAGLFVVGVALAACATAVDNSQGTVMALPCPDGPGMAAVFMAEDSNSGLEVRGLTGTGEISTLTVGGVSRAPVFMSGGERILFVRDVVPERGGGLPARGALWTMDAQGRDERQLLPTDDASGWKSLIEAVDSPDGSLIAFVGITQENQERARLHLVGADGTGLRQLTGLDDERTFFDLEVAWSPDGEKLAFLRQTPEGEMYGFQVGVVDPDGGGEEILYETSNLLDSLSWAADGTIVFNHYEGAQSALMQADVADKLVSQLATGSFSPALTADGAQVTYWESPPNDEATGRQLRTVRIFDGAQATLSVDVDLNLHVGLSIAPCQP